MANTQNPVHSIKDGRTSGVASGARVSLTPFIGRESELREIGERLEATRLLTLAGVGGTGKTRLGLEVARHAGEQQDVIVVELASIDTPEQIAGAICLAISAAGLDGPPPPGDRSALEAAADHLHSRTTLLVLDNCEHLVDGCARVVISLLSRCHGLRVLATSRKPLGVDGETVWPVPPLSLPDPRASDLLTAALGSEAGRLFADRAARTRPGFELTSENAEAVASICRELDGLPLAIELAAGRARVLSPAQIAIGLADRMRILGGGPRAGDERLQSMRASLDWSHALLQEPERVLMRRLAIASEWTIDAVEEVCATDDEERAAALDALGALAGHGLLKVIDADDELRYTMLETVRSYALWHLQSAGEESAVRRRHVRYYLQVAASADERLQTPAGRQRLERDTPQLLGALEFALHDDPSLALQIAADLGPWWLIHESYGQARDACSRVLAATVDSQPRARAQVLWAAALLAIHDEDYDQARIYAEEAFPLADASGDPCTIGRWMAMAANAQRSIDANAAAAIGAQAVEILEAESDTHGLAFALANLALTEGMRDRFAAVRETCSQFAALAGEKPPWLLPWVENALAWADISQGRPARALQHCARAVELEAGRVTLPHYIATAHRLYAMALAGDAAAAHQEGLAEVDRTRQAGLAIAMGAIERSVANAELALGELDSAQQRAERGCALAHRYTAAEWRETLIRIMLARGQTEPALSHAQILREFAQTTNSARKLAQADWGEGAAILHLEPQKAGELLHGALCAQFEQGLLPEAIDTLETLGELSLAVDHATRGARLIGAARSARRTLGVVALPVQARVQQALSEHCQQSSLEGKQCIAALAEGEGMTLTRATDYARRGRGRRGRPARGWESLSPVQIEVATLATQGLSNPQIGARLFISRGTVKSHLTQIYRKLGVENRVQLTAISTARRRGDQSERGG